MTAYDMIEDRVEIPDAPSIPGLSFRRFRGETDFPKMVAVIAASAQADRVERVDTVEEVQKNYQHLVNSDPATDTVFAEIDGEVVGFSRVFWFQEEATRHRIYASFGFLTPQWRRQGIGRAILKHNQRRLREIAADHPYDGERFLRGWAFNNEIGTIAMLVQDGYQPVAHGALMVRPDLENLPEAQLPDGVEVRPVEEAHLPAIHAAEVEAFRDHWGFSPELEAHPENWVDTPYVDPSLWRVAWVGDQVVGMVRSFINPRENEKFERLRGWTEHISVRRPWRRQGVARALLCMSLHAIRERGMAEGALGVHVENPNGAFHLYESVGFRMVRLDTDYRKPLD